MSLLFLLFLLFFATPATFVQTESLSASADSDSVFEEDFPMKISIKRFLVGVVTLALLGVFGVTAFAVDTTDSGTGSVTGNVTINGSISALTLSVSHPINVAYAISPDVWNVYIPRP
jgi:hypothetical protein